MTEHGRIIDGKPVIGGVFRLYETEGIPLGVIVDRIHASGAIVDWLNFYDDAIAAKMKPGKVISLLDEVLGDVYDPTTKRTILATLGKLRGDR